MGPLLIELWTVVVLSACRLLSSCPMQEAGILLTTSSDSTTAEHAALVRATVARRRHVYSLAHSDFVHAARVFDSIAFPNGLPGTHPSRQEPVLDG